MLQKRLHNFSIFLFCFHHLPHPCYNAAPITALMVFLHVHIHVRMMLTVTTLDLAKKNATL